ncbi:MAG TPA: IS110 family transposase [Azospirillaceae bacterium]|nr:IS110 family transposase [Azospirillaceae bacterium]
MSSQPAYIVGIDVSKDALDLHILTTAPAGAAPQPTASRLPNSHKGCAALLRRLRQLPGPALVVAEASGDYERLMLDALERAAVPHALVNPGRVRDFARASGQLAKTDRLDAAVIARFAAVTRPRPRTAPSPARRRLRELLAYDGQLAAELASGVQRLRGFQDPGLRARAEARLAGLRRERAELAAEIAAQVGSEAELAVPAALMRSVPGVGPWVAAMALAHLPELGGLSDKAVASLCGLAPFARDSGLLRGRRMIRGGRAPLRRALYLAALTAIRREGPLKAFYDRLRQRGKPAKVALAACMRKIATILNAIVRDQTPFQSKPA